MLRSALLTASSILALTLSSLPAHAASLPPQSENAPKLVEPPPDASVEQLVERGDELRAEKALTSSLEFYETALAKTPDDASVRNRIAIIEMELGRWKSSIRELQAAIESEPDFADAYNNIGVDYYELKNSKKAIAFYRKAIRLREDEASFYSNLGAAYFSRKEFEKAAAAYTRALQIDPDVLDHTSRTGVSARLPSPDDRARFDYAIAKLYARMGATDYSLEHLRRALEEGYKRMEDVYKDEEFASLRKDPRFTELMAKPPVQLHE